MNIAHAAGLESLNLTRCRGLTTLDSLPGARLHTLICNDCIRLQHPLTVTRLPLPALRCEVPCFSWLMTCCLAQTSKPQTCRTLCRVLSVAASPGMLPAALAACLGCRQLQSLDVSSTCDLEDVCMQAMLRASSSLQSLTAASLPMLRCSTPGLRLRLSLHVADSRHPLATHSSCRMELTEPLSCASSLTQLCLRDCPSLEDHGMCAIASLTALQVLELSDCQHFSDEGAPAVCACTCLAMRLHHIVVAVIALGPHLPRLLCSVGQHDRN